MDTQVAVKLDVHFTVYDDEWDGYTKCGLPILSSGAVVATNWAAVTCPGCKPG